MQFGELLLVIFNEFVSQFTELNVGPSNSQQLMLVCRTDRRINDLLFVINYLCPIILYCIDVEKRRLRCLCVLLFVTHFITMRLLKLTV